MPKPDPLKLAKKTGDLQQNVNFATHGDTVRAFLERPRGVLADKERANSENTEFARRKVQATVGLRCLSA